MPNKLAICNCVCQPDTAELLEVLERGKGMVSWNTDSLHASGPSAHWVRIPVELIPEASFTSLLSSSAQSPKYIYNINPCLPLKQAMKRVLTDDDKA